MPRTSHRVPGTQGVSSGLLERTDASDGGGLGQQETALGMHPGDG